MIAKTAVKTFLDKKLEDWSWVKDLTLDDMLNELEIIAPKFRFKTLPFKHQLACFIIGIYNPMFLFLLDMGLGKMLRESEPVLTPTGWVKIGELGIDDEICTIDGEVQKVTEVFRHKNRKMYRIIFTDDTEVIACEDHQWEVSTTVKKYRKQSGIIKTTKELYREELHLTTTQTEIGNTKYFIPVVNSVKFNKQKVLIDPYLLGLLLGDGGLSSRTIVLTNSDEEIVDYVKQTVVEYGLTVKKYSDISYGITGSKGRTNLLTTHLENLGLWGLKSEGKFIPDQYLFNTENVRIAILQGLMDTDGYIRTADGTVQFSTVSERLKNDVKFIINSLGGTCKENIKLSKYTHNGEIRCGQRCFNLIINLPERITPCRLKRKLACMKQNRKYLPYRGVKKVEYFGREDGVCISVSDPSKLYIIHDFIVTHNTKIVLDLIRYYRKNDLNINKTLVLVPGPVNIYGFADEVKIHSNLSCVELYGFRQQRWNLLENVSAALYILNYAGLQSMLMESRDGSDEGRIPNMKAVKRFSSSFDSIICDEVHLLKNHNTVTYKLINMISRGYKVRYGLTGTPLGIDPQDLWTQFYFVDNGETLGRTLSIFREAFFKTTINYWGGYEHKFIKEKDELLQKRLRNKSIRYDESEVKELPKRVDRLVKIKLSHEARGYYDSMVKGLIRVRGNYQEVEAIFVRLRQICSGYLQHKLEDERISIDFENNPKMDSLLTLLDSIPKTAKVVIFHEFIHSGNKIAKELSRFKYKYVRLYGATQDKKGAKDKFVKDKKCQIFLVNTNSGGTGLNLQVAQYVIRYESTVSSIIRKQSDKRVHRTGQKKRTFFYDLVIENSVEEKILQYINEGKNLFKAIVDGKERL